MSLGGLVGQQFGRRASESGKSSIDGEWNLDLFPDVTEQPTRKHWKVSWNRSWIPVKSSSHANTI